MDKDIERRKLISQEITKIKHWVNSPQPTRIPGVIFKPFFDNGHNEKYLCFESNFIQRSAIGCGLAHINAWEQIVKNGDKMGLVLEDDAIISHNFSEIFKKVVDDLPEDFDMLFLGCMVFCNPEKDMSFFEKMFLKQKENVTVSDNLFVPSRPLALHAYILSKKGAKKLLNFFKEKKLTHHIDKQMLQCYADMKVYAVEPKIINQRFTEGKSSNNTTKYPHTFSKIGSIVTFKDADAAYFMGIARYEIGGVPLCGWVSIFVFLGYMFTDIQSMTAFFLILHSIEMVLSKEIHINDGIVYYIAMLLGFLLRKKVSF